MKSDIKLTAKKIKRSKKNYKFAKITLLVLIAILTAVYLIASFVYNGYFFTVSLDQNLYYKNKIIIYDSKDYKVYRQNLKVESLDFFDNISYKWLPDNLEDEDGSHNGDNYLAYTFYIENTGDKTVDYYDEIIIDEVIKKLDEAIRVRVYFDGVDTTYAKESSLGKEEDGTTKFKSNKIIRSEHISNFKPNEVHKYTIVMWLEGSDPECTDNILGGEIKVHMEFKSEFKD